MANSVKPKFFARTCPVPSHSQLFPLGTRPRTANSVTRSALLPGSTPGSPSHLLRAKRIARVLRSRDGVGLDPAQPDAAGERRSGGKRGSSLGPAGPALPRTSPPPEGPAALVAGAVGAVTGSGPLRRSAGRGPGEGRARRADLRCAPAPAREPDLERLAPAGPEGAARRSLPWPRTLLLARGRRPPRPAAPAPSPRPGRPPLPAAHLGRAHLGRAHLPPGAWAAG